MKLWLLRPADGLDPKDDPWEPWYEKAFGFVVRAETEADARALAQTNERAGAEKDHTWERHRGRRPTNPWMEPAYSTCVELTADGTAEVVLVDFAQG